MEPFSLLTVSETGKLPADEYVTTGFSSVLVDGVPPSKVHEREMTRPVDMSEKLTLPPTATECESAVKSAAGADVPS